MKYHLYILIFLLFCLLGSADDDLEIEEELYEDMDDEVEEAPADEPEEIETFEEPVYEPMTSAKGSLLFENFQSGMDSWTHSSSADFPGRFEVGAAALNPAISSEHGLFVPREAQRYAIFGSLSSPFDFRDEAFVVQYELRLNTPLQCGGAYIKLTSKQDDWKSSDVTNETPYTVMFGPDKCGTTNKVHFIWRFKNPVTEEYVEHHLSSTVMPASVSDKKSHLYTLVVRPDNSYEIFVDKQSKSSGSLLEDFEPPLVPPKEIDDPTDSKPEDWVDEAKIPDPEAEKPEDWDEDAPRQIPDPDSEKPEGWLDDEPLEIPDPNASEPEDWDEEDDGEWEAPIVDNPACSVGCGPWEPEMIPNPDYKGKWYPPMIDNPDYIGEWKARQIDNPAYFEEDNPFAKLDSVMGVTIDIWTMQKGTEYDNIYVGTSEDGAWELASNWEIRKGFQDSAMGSPEIESSDDPTAAVMEFLSENLVAVGATSFILLLSIFFLCCGSATPEAVQAEQAVAAAAQGVVEEEADAPVADEKETKEEKAAENES